jgi:hypothetical protein
MKHFACAAVAIWICITACQAGLAGWLTQERRDWAFIESVGGMKVKASNHRLDVTCDVSGTRRITREPTFVNSGIGVRKLDWTREGSVIRLTVVTSLMEKGMSCSCGSIDLSKLPAGSYAVEYLNPDKTTRSLGSITLN